MRLQDFTKRGPAWADASWAEIIMSVVFLITAFLFLGVRAQGQEDRRFSRVPAVLPDILLILVDDMGYDDLTIVNANGHAPNIHNLASTGYRFLNASSNPICAPTRRSIYTGHFFSKQSGIPCEPPNALTPPTSLEFIAERIAPTYAGILYGKWHVGTNPNGNWRDVYSNQGGFVSWRAGLAYHVRGCLSQDYNNWRSVEDGQESFLVGQYQPTVMMNRFALTWPALPSPRLAVFATQLAHEPYHRPPSNLLPGGASYPATPDARSRFEAMIAALDVQVGQLMANVNLATTVVIFVSDNGTPQDVSSNPTHAKTTTFQEGIHVPMFMVGAGIPSGETYALTHVADIYATICELAGTAAPVGLDSRSLMPLVNGTAIKIHDYVASGVDSQEPPFDKDLCARSLRYKLRRVTDKVTGVTHEEFYDLLTDPLELIDLITDPTLQTKIAAHRTVINTEFP